MENLHGKNMLYNKVEKVYTKETITKAIYAEWEEINEQERINRAENHYWTFLQIISGQLKEGFVMIINENEDGWNIISEDEYKSKLIKNRLK